MVKTFHDWNMKELFSRPAAMLDAVVRDNLWIDRDALREHLPIK